MSVQKRRSGRRTRWVVRWEEEGRHRQRTLDTRAEAIAFDAELKAQLRRRRQLGGFAPQEASDRLLRTHIEISWRQRSVGWETTTKETWADILDSWILPLLGDVPLRDLNRARVREFRAQMVSEGVRLAGGGRRRIASPNRANAVMTVLSAFCGYAVEDGLIPENPCRDVHRLPHKASKHRAHPPLVIERIRARMGQRDALVVSLMYLAGLRPEEVLALQWRHVGEKVLLIEQAATGGRIKGTKTGTGATVEITPVLAEDLAARRRAVGPGPDDLVIEGRQGEGILRLRPWRANVWHAARRAAGVEQATPYDCRHTFGSLLIHEGRDILEVQRAMRHASARTTLEHYAHEFAEWKGRDKVTLEEAVRAARAQVAAELADDAHDDRGGDHDVAAPEVEGPPPGAGDPSPGGDDDAGSVARKLRTGAPGSDEESAENAEGTGDGPYWARTSDPQLVELAEVSARGDDGPRESGREADGEGDDEPPLDRVGRPRLRESCAPRRGTHPSPSAPLGRCEDCGQALEQGLEGAFCAPCEIECPGCGEADCFASCEPRGSEVAAARARARDRRRAPRRLGDEHRRAHERRVWTLSGARA